MLQWRRFQCSTSTFRFRGRGRSCCVVYLRRLLLFAATVAVTLTTRPARASELPADLCALLPAAEVSKTLGQAFADPAKSVAPRPFANTNTGTDCKYKSKSGSELWFRAYVDPSPSAAAELFARLSTFYSPPTPVKDLGDEAYFDPEHALHVRKGKVRFYLNLSPVRPATEKQLKDLGNLVAGRL